MRAKPKLYGAICRHCQRPEVVVTRPRGLCWTCYYTPGVKGRYPADDTRGGGRRSSVPTTGKKRLPAEATDARPGSDEKIAVLAGRAARGELLWHPGDSTG